MSNWNCTPCDGALWAEGGQLPGTSESLTIWGLLNCMGSDILKT